MVTAEHSIPTAAVRIPEPTRLVSTDYEEDMVEIQQETQRFNNPKAPLLQPTVDGRATENNHEHIQGILHDLLPFLLKQAPALSQYLLERPQDLQDLVDMLAIHEDGEPDYDGNGNSDMPTSILYSAEQQLTIKEQERLKFETWVLPLFHVDDQPRIHALYLAFEQNDTSNWVAQLANCLDKIHGDLTAINRRWSLMSHEELTSESTLGHLNNGLKKELPSFFRVLELLESTPQVQTEIAHFLLNLLEKYSALGFDDFAPELTAAKEKIRTLYL